MPPLKIAGRKISVIVGTPCRLDYNVDAELVTWVIDAMLRGVVTGWKFVPSRTPEDGRNLITKWFLEDCKEGTHLMYMDTDTVPEDKMCLERMLRHNAPIVAGMTPVYYRKHSNIKNAQGMFKWNVLVDAGNNPPRGKTLRIGEVPSKPFYADTVGGTTILVSRKALSAIPSPWFFTDRDRLTGDIICGEDYWFFDRAREKGMRPLVDPSVVCHHRQFLDLLELHGAMKENMEVGGYDRAGEVMDMYIRSFGAGYDGSFETNDETAGRPEVA